MNALQAQYAKAKAHFELARELATVSKKQTLPDISTIKTDAELEEYYVRDGEIDDKFGVWQSFDSLLSAEKDMVEWSFRVAKSLPKYVTHQAELSPLLASWQKHPSIRRKVVELAFLLKG